MSEWFEQWTNDQAGPNLYKKRIQLLDLAPLT